MTRVVVDVMLKPEILDPQGQALARALPRLGFAGVTSVRQGKRFEIEFSEAYGRPERVRPAETGVSDESDESDESETSELPRFSETSEPSGLAEPAEPFPPSPHTEEDVLARARQIAETLLANPVIEDFEVRVLR